MIVTREVNSNGTPSVRLPGRNVVGTLPMPQHNIPNATGEVVVSIRVDQHGNLTSANVTQTGTTVQNRTLWDAAVEAALKTKFNVSSNAPIVQAGFITYVFNLPNSDKKVDRKKSPPRR
ncbi:MAG: hypothetical protein FWE30_05505 [Bacteroidales bacterium]|nr:hypothetical protein [Bacteroidales bacterium]